MARRSEKPVVFKVLFQRRYKASTGVFTPQTVTSDELQDAITVLRADEGISLSVANPANFLKDFLRQTKRNQQWPAEIAAAGFTARQAYGAGRVFDFVPYGPGQTVPFPDDFDLPENAIIHKIETVSLPSAARELGREDEAWLIQVCVHQRILQTHFALFSDLNVTDLFHLQNSLKGTPEIDAVFLLSFTVDNGPRKALITFEAKRKDPILPDQIKSQVAYMAHQTRKRKALNDIEFIVPVAAATISRAAQRIVAVFEMEAISVEDGVTAYDNRTQHELPLAIAKSVGYVLSPQVSGI